MRQWSGRARAWRPRREAKSTAAVRHERLANAEEAERMKTYWRERVATLKRGLER